MRVRVCTCACVRGVTSAGETEARAGSMQVLRRGVQRLPQHLSPTPGDPFLGPQVFVKCHFDYDPATDSLIPCKEAGLKFMAGDLLQIVNQDDPNWWQVRGVPRVVVAGVLALLPPLPGGAPGSWGPGGAGGPWGWGGSLGAGGGLWVLWVGGP